MNSTESAPASREFSDHKSIEFCLTKYVNDMLAQHRTNLFWNENCTTKLNIYQYACYNKRANANGKRNSNKIPQYEKMLTEIIKIELKTVSIDIFCPYVENCFVLLIYPGKALAFTAYRENHPQAQKLF